MACSTHCKSIDVVIMLEEDIPDLLEGLSVYIMQYDTHEAISPKSSTDSDIVPNPQTPFYIHYEYLTNELKKLGYPI